LFNILQKFSSSWLLPDRVSKFVIHYQTPQSRIQDCLFHSICPQNEKNNLTRLSVKCFEISGLLKKCKNYE